MTSQQVYECIKDATGCALVGDADRLRDLGMDSLDLVALVNQLEDASGKSSQGLLGRFERVFDLVDFFAEVDVCPV